MTITPTGLVGVGQIAPLSFLHLNSTGNAVGGEVFRTTSSSVISRWRLENANGEIFRVTANGNATFLESMGIGGYFAFNTTGNMGTFTRMLMRDGTDDEFSGRIAMGNNLPLNFSIQDRLHLHEDVAHLVRLRFTNVTTQNAASDGSTIGIEADGEYRFTQFEDIRMSFLMPFNTPTTTSSISCMRIEPNGRTYVGRDISHALTNRFTIDSEWNNPTNPDATKSGLRFVDLLSTETPIANPGTGVLSVDAQGNVIYVPGGGAGIAAAENGTSIFSGRVVLGQSPGDPLNPGRLLNDREIPLEDNEINLSGQGTIHISQGSAALNTNAALDVNTSASGANSSIGINFAGKTSNNLVNEKGIQAAMNLNTLAANNNTALLDLSNTVKVAGASGWLMKANGFYGTNFAADLPDQASFGVLGNGNTVVNANLATYGVDRANLFVTDFTGAANTGGNPYGVTNPGGSRTMLVSNVNATGVNYGIDVFVDNETSAATGVRSIARGTAAASVVNAVIAQASSSSASAGFATGLSADGTSSTGSQRTFGVSASANGSNLLNTAVGGVATSGTSGTNIAIDGLAEQGVNNMGVRGRATVAGTTNRGVYGAASGGSAENASIYGDAASGPGNNYAGYFNGFTYVNSNLEVNGVVNASNGTPLTSDVSLKTNINPITGALDIVNALGPRSFYFDTLNAYGFNFNSKKNYGFIAQDVETVLPELVNQATKNAQYDSLGNEVVAAYDYKTLNYNAFIGILTKAVQEQQSELHAKDSVIANQQSQLDDLNSRLSQLESCLSALLPSLCEMNQMAVQQTPEETQRQLKQKASIVLSDKNTVVLTQNVPNPFAETTTISYNIPATVAQAQIHFYNAQGKLIHSVEITERGSGELTIFASDLSSGMYSYSLVADGKIVATKKMVKI